jgi:hypothetical protein
MDVQHGDGGGIERQFVGGFCGEEPGADERGQVGWDSGCHIFFIFYFFIFVFGFGRIEGRLELVG